jgi:hypothetical protein
MPIYRCYFLDEHDRIGEVETIDAPDPDSATGLARQLLLTNEKYARFAGIEVWHEARRVFTDATS